MKMHRIIVGAILALIPLAALTAKPYIQQVSIPPPGQYGIENLWNVTLNNPDNQTYEVWLEGTITEATKGQVLWAKTNKFQLPPGTKVIRYADIQSIGIDQQTYAPGYEDFAVRTGGLIEGTYAFTVKLEPSFGSKSAKFDVRQLLPVKLLAPPNGQAVTIERPTFVWTAPPSGGKGYDYVFALKEVVQGQGIAEAWRDNPWHYVARDIVPTSYTYPASAPALDSGHTYIWNVSYYPKGRFPWNWPLPWDWYNWFPKPKEPASFVCRRQGGGGGSTADTVQYGDHATIMMALVKYAPELGRGIDRSLRHDLGDLLKSPRVDPYTKSRARVVLAAFRMLPDSFEATRGPSAAAQELRRKLQGECWTVREMADSLESIQRTPGRFAGLNLTAAAAIIRDGVRRGLYTSPLQTALLCGLYTKTGSGILFSDTADGADLEYSINWIEVAAADAEGATDTTMPWWKGAMKASAQDIKDQQKKIVARQQQPPPLYPPATDTSPGAIHARLMMQLLLHQRDVRFGGGRTAPEVLCSALHSSGVDSVTKRRIREALVRMQRAVAEGGPSPAPAGARESLRARLLGCTSPRELIDTLTAMRSRSAYRNLDLDGAIAIVSVGYRCGLYPDPDLNLDMIPYQLAYTGTPLPDWNPDRQDAYLFGGPGWEKFKKWWKDHWRDVVKVAAADLSGGLSGGWIGAGIGSVLAIP